MKKIFVLLLVFLSFYGRSQNPEATAPPNFAPRTPEAAAFLQYGEHPVDLSSGTTNISVPLYTIESKDFKLPITLNYHASGIKVDQESTWVGLGWNLDFGAQVILSPSGKVDEGDGQINNIPTQAQFDAFYDANPYSFTSGPANGEPIDADVDRIKDVFIFSSPTANGRFILLDNAAVVFPPDAFKVSGSVLGGFIITDTFGNTYVLTVIEKSVRPATHQDFYNTAWFVKKIITASGNTIDFKYYEGSSGDEDVFKTTSISQYVTVTKTTPNCHCTTQSPTSRLAEQMRTDNGLVTAESKKIKEISFNGGQSKVEFVRIRDREDQELSDKNSYLFKMEVRHKGQNGQFNLVKGYMFEYGYFTATGINSGPTHFKKRLRLESVTPFPAPQEASYVFEYSEIIPPRKTSFSSDIFGYYNGKSNSDFIPEHYFPALQGGQSPAITVGSANREVDSAYNQAGILKKIIYPSKGWTKFNYETNQYYGTKNNKILFDGCSVLGVSETGGGSANPNPSTIDTCTWPIALPTYGTLTITYQVTNNLGGIYNENKHHYTELTLEASDGDAFPPRRHLQTGEHTFVLDLGPGAYTLVLSAYGDSMHISARDIVFSYTTEDNIDAAGLRIGSIANYDNDGTLVLLKKYDYSLPCEAQEEGPCNIVKSSGIFVKENNHLFTSIPRTNLLIDACTGSLVNKALVTERFNVSSSTRYGTESNSIVYRYVTERVINPLDSLSNGKTQHKFTAGGDWVLNGFNVQIQTPWERGKLLEKKVFATSSGSDRLLREEVNFYNTDTRKAAVIKGFKLIWRKTVSPSVITGDALYELEECQAPRNAREAMTTLFLNYSFYWQYLQSTTVKEFFYDEAGNPLDEVVTNTTYHYDNPDHQQLTNQVSVNSKGQTLQTKYFYAHDLLAEDHVQDLIDKNMIATPLIVETHTGAAQVAKKRTAYEIDASTAGLLLPKFVQTSVGTGSLETEITYDKYDSDGTPIQYTLRNGMPVTLIWDFNNINLVAKIENMAYANVPSGLISAIKSASETGTEASMASALNNLRTDAAMNEAMVTTYTHYPLIGVSKITGPNGISTKYDYDSQGRLSNVRDDDGKLLKENEYHYKN